MFFGCFLDFSKKKIKKKKNLLCFLDFQGFWFWKILKIQQNLLLFWIFPVFIEKSKKHNVFLDFRWFYSKNPKNLFFLHFQ